MFNKYLAGCRVYAARKYQRMTQFELAEKMCYGDVSSISHAERGKSNALYDIRTMEHYSEALGVTRLFLSDGIISKDAEEEIEKIAEKYWHKRGGKT